RACHPQGRVRLGRLCLGAVCTWALRRCRPGHALRARHRHRGSAPRLPRGDDRRRPWPHTGGAEVADGRAGSEPGLRSAPGIAGAGHTRAPHRQACLMKRGPILRRVGLAAVAAAATMGVLAGPASAHPLGNFTINHYAEVRVGERQIQLDVVIDMAEIPAFTEQQRLDSDHDGTVSPAELAAARQPTCLRLASSLVLAMGSRPMSLQLTASGLQLLSGAGGLKTLRTVCEYSSQLTGALGASGASGVVRFEDRSYADRIGWREIVVSGDGTTVESGSTERTTRSARLTRYPTDLLATPLDERSATIAVRPGGPTLPALRPADAQAPGATLNAVARVAGAGPGGVGHALASLIGT